MMPLLAERMMFCPRKCAFLGIELHRPVKDNVLIHPAFFGEPLAWPFFSCDVVIGTMDAHGDLLRHTGTFRCDVVADFWCHGSTGATGQLLDRLVQCAEVLASDGSLTSFSQIASARRIQRAIMLKPRRNPIALSECLHVMKESNESGSGFCIIPCATVNAR